MTPSPRRLPGLRAAEALLLLGLLGSSPGCVALQARIAAGELVDGLYAMPHARARIAERGLLVDEPETRVVKELLLDPPWRVRAEVVAPVDHAGTLLACDGETLALWWPRYFFGLRIRGLEPPTREQLAETARANTRWLLERFAVEDAGRQSFAGRPVRHWELRPDPARPFHFAYDALVDAEYAIPLRLRVYERPGQVWYGLSFRSLEPAGPLAPEAFQFAFPAGAVVYDWDLQAPGVSLAEAQARAEFPILLPAALPPGHRLEKLITTRYEDMTMVAALMRRGASWLSLTQMPNLGPILVPEIGIPVQLGGEPAVVNFAGGFTVVSWALGDTALTLIGNQPFPQVLAVAASLEASEEDGS